MPLFTDISGSFKDLNILILGSYKEDDLRILRRLKKKLIRQGFLQTKLGMDIPEDLESQGTSQERIYAKIINAMKETDCNIFLFFAGNDVSTAVELLSLLEQNFLDTHLEKVLIFFPQEFDSIMLEGFARRHKLYIFSYQNEEQIYQKSVNFLKQLIATSKN